MKIESVVIRERKKKRKRKLEVGAFTVGSFGGSGK